MITLTGGNFQDGRGNLLNGFITLQLTADASIIATPGQVLRAIPVTFSVLAGNVVGSCKVYSNAELTPGTQYQVNIADLNRSRLGDPILWQFSQAAGSTVDIGTMTSITQGGPSVSFPFGQQSQTSTAAMSFSASSFNQFLTTMTTNVSSSAMVSGIAGTLYTFIFVQDGAGGHTFSWPANVIDPQAIDTAPNVVCAQTFCFDGTNFRPISGLTE